MPSRDDVLSFLAIALGGSKARDSILAGREATRERQLEEERLERERNIRALPFIQNLLAGSDPEGRTLPSESIPLTETEGGDLGLDPAQAPTSTSGTPAVDQLGELFGVSDIGQLTSIAQAGTRSTQIQEEQAREQNLETVGAEAGARVTATEIAGREQFNTPEAAAIRASITEDEIALFNAKDNIRLQNNIALAKQRAIIQATADGITLPKNAAEGFAYSMALDLLEDPGTIGGSGAQWKDVIASALVEKGMSKGNALNAASKAVKAYHPTDGEIADPRAVAERAFAKRIIEKNAAVGSAEFNAAASRVLGTSPSISPEDVFGTFLDTP